jgi:hypothetical protein
MNAVSLGDGEVSLRGFDIVGTTGAASWHQVLRYAAVILVVAIHVAALWMLTLEMRFPAPLPKHDLELTLLMPSMSTHETAAAPPAPNFKTPEDVLIPEPEITFEAGNDVSGPVVTGEGIIEKLAPRLDPHHVNQRPQLPHTMGAAIAGEDEARGYSSNMGGLLRLLNSLHSFFRERRCPH